MAITKNDYINEFLKQRNSAFGLKDKDTVAKWTGKGKNAKLDAQVENFVANYNGEMFRCYEVEMNGAKETMLCLVSDKYCDTVNTAKQVRVSHVYSLVEVSYLYKIRALKLELNKVMYLMNNDDLKVRSTNCMHILIANELRLILNTEYSDGKLHLRSRYNENVRFSLMELGVDEYEMSKLQYAEHVDDVDSEGKKYLSAENTLKKGDVGYDELGLGDKGVLYYTICNGMQTSQRYSNRNFFDKKVFLADCRWNGKEAIEYNEKDKKLKELLNTKKTVCGDSLYEASLMGADRVYYTFSRKSLKLLCVLKNNIFQYEFIAQQFIEHKKVNAKVISTYVKEDKAEIANRRKEMIDTYTRSEMFNSLDKNGCVNTIDENGVKFSYSYDSKHDLLVLEKMDYTGVDLRIGSEFDAVKAFFREDIVTLDLNNVQYIVESRSGFKHYNKLRYVRGEKLKLTTMVNLETETMSTYHRRDYKDYARLGYAFAKAKYFYFMADLLLNDLLFYVTDNCRVYFSSLEFHMLEYKNKGRFREYEAVQKIKDGHIGYSSQKEYLKYYKRTMEERW